MCPRHKRGFQLQEMNHDYICHDPGVYCYSRLPWPRIYVGADGCDHNSIQSQSYKRLFWLKRNGNYHFYSLFIHLNQVNWTWKYLFINVWLNTSNHLPAHLLAGHSKIRCFWMLVHDLRSNFRRVTISPQIDYVLCDNLKWLSILCLILRRSSYSCIQFPLDSKLFLILSGNLVLHKFAHPGAKEHRSAPA